jgi:hypothetical protein
MVFPLEGKSFRFFPFSKVLNRFECKVNCGDTAICHTYHIYHRMEARGEDHIPTIQKVVFHGSTSRLKSATGFFA